jgi:hypothetical protein
MGYRIAQALEKLPEEEVLDLIPSIKAGDLSAAQLEALVVKPTEKPSEEPNQQPVDSIASGALIEHLEPSENLEPDYEPEEDQGKNNVKPNAAPSFEEQGSHAKTARQEKQSKSDLAHENDGNSQNGSAYVEESDLDRANKLETRICERISVVWVADSGTSDNAVIKLSIHSALASFLIKNQDYLQKLMSNLKEEAALSLLREVPLDIFDDVTAAVAADDSQVDWTE